MKLCIFAKSLPVHIKGGMERHIEDLVNGLIKKGYEVTVITTKHPKGIQKEERENLRIYYVGDKSLRYTKKFFNESIKLFNYLHKKVKFDIVHSQSGAGIGYALKCKKTAPLVITFHGIASTEARSLQNEGGITKKLFSKYILFRDYIYYHIFNHKIFFLKADKIIAVSNQLREEIRNYYGVPEEKIITIPNGIDTNIFKPMNTDDLRTKLKLSEKIILSVGRIEKQKGYHLLLKTLPDIAKNYDVNLVIVGTGPYLPNLKKIAAKLDISNKVVFTGRVSDEDLPRYYNLADIFAFPTLRIEGLPLVIPEAMACEKPTIASRIGGISTVIEDGKDGFLITPGNLKDLKNKILTLLRDERLASKIAKRARRKVVERFSVDTMVENTIKVYEEVVSNGKY